MRSTRRSITPRRMSALLAALLALTWGGILVIPALASAQSQTIISIWDITDDMDANDVTSTWRFERSGEGTGSFNRISPRSAPNSAFLSMRAPGFSSVARDVTLPLPLFDQFRSCSARVFINTVFSGRRVNVEIINPANWRYVGLKEATVDPAGGYTPVDVSWLGGPHSVVFRVSVLGSAGVTSAAWVDDLHINCAIFCLPFSTSSFCPAQ